MCTKLPVGVWKKSTKVCGVGGTLPHIHNEADGFSGVIVHKYSSSTHKNWLFQGIASEICIGLTVDVASDDTQGIWSADSFREFHGKVELEN